MWTARSRRTHPLLCPRRSLLHRRKQTLIRISSEVKHSSQSHAQSRKRKPNTWAPKNSVNVNKPPQPPSVTHTSSALAGSPVTPTPRLPKRSYRAAGRIVYYTGTTPGACIAAPCSTQLYQLGGAVKILGTIAARSYKTDTGAQRRRRNPPFHYTRLPHSNTSIPHHYPTTPQKQRAHRATGPFTPNRRPPITKSAPPTNQRTHRSNHRRNR